LFPIEERDSFKRLISGHPESLPESDTSRNTTLLITASLASRAGWSIEKTYNTIIETQSRWHGMVDERGGKEEIMNTIRSAYKTGYTYTKNNPIISHNMSDEERKRTEDAFAKVIKDRREIDKVRYSTYELEIFAKYPYIKKNHAGLFYNYENGYYKILSQHDVRKIILDSMYEDMMWGYRTTSQVDAKVMCLRAIIPVAEETLMTNVINVKNGLLDIRTLELKPHTPDYVSFYQHPVDYTPDAKAPVWEKCLSDWMEGDEKEEKIKILKTYTGYILSNTMKFHKALFLIGDGSNGKSTYADTIAMLMGKQATSHISLSDLHKDFGLAELFGKKLNVVEEVAGNKIFDSDIMKKVFSGEPVQANIKYQPMFEFKPQCKFIFALNEMPKINDTTMGTQRRLLTVTFGNDFGLKNDKNVDVNLRGEGGKLHNELPGILNWAIEGFKELEKDEKFISTREHEETMKEFREENSSVDVFISDWFDFDEHSEIDADDVYILYVSYVRQNGGMAKKKQTVIKELKAMSKRTGWFHHVPRNNGRENSKFKGIKRNQYSNQNLESDFRKF